MKLETQNSLCTPPP